MKILVALFVYNERKYLPAFLSYYRKQGCDFVFVDNMSTDGTFQYLIKEKVSVKRLDTKDSFHLRMLQDELTKEIAKRRPDWVVYTGADTYFVFEKTIRQTIEEAHKEGFNQIATKCLEAMNTGETFKLPFNLTFKYGYVQRKLRYMISRYMEGFYIEADKIVIKNPNIKPECGILINYGACKPNREQIKKLERREKAWDMGMNKQWGIHYLEHQKKDWIWNPNNLTYFPKTEYWRYIKKL